MIIPTIRLYNMFLLICFVFGAGLLALCSGFFHQSRHHPYCSEFMLNAVIIQREKLSYTNNSDICTDVTARQYIVLLI
jgi:hypothetical protein